MAQQAQDIINAAARKIRAIAAGDALNTNELADGLVDLNMLIDSMNTDGTNIYTIEVDTYTFIPNTQTHTIGPGQQMNGPRPTNIEKANVINLANPSLPTRTDLDILDAVEWGSIPNLSAGSPIPQKVYFDYGYPTGNISFWPYPTVANQVEIYNWKQLSSFSALTTTVSLPYGYWDLLVYNLAIRMAPDYGVEATPTVLKLAQEAIVNVQSSNIQLPDMSVDSALRRVGRQGGVYNWITNRP